MIFFVKKCTKKFLKNVAALNHQTRESTLKVHKKRGRPRGPNYYKKKTPHHRIDFQELAKEVVICWDARKDKCHAKHNAMVEEKKQKYNAEKKARKKAKCLKHVNPRTI